jgi:hypothetical protein
VYSYADRAAVIRLYDTAVSGMASDYPSYYIEHGKRKGVHQFQFVTESEFRQWGESRAKEMEWGRIRSKRISANPDVKRELNESRKHRRNTVPGLREREVEMERNRRRKRMTDASNKVKTYCFGLHVVR